MTIGETTVITYTDAEKTSNEHIMTSECYDTIGESDLIGYMDAIKASYQHIKTSEPYKTIGDTDIVVYIGVITEELFEAICKTVCISYMDALKTSNVSIKVLTSDSTIEKTNETSNDFLDDIMNSRVAGAMWWSADHRIERGCETSLPLSSDIRDIPPLLWWLKVMHLQ